jgi:hypothetical protein
VRIARVPVDSPRFPVPGQFPAHKFSLPIHTETRLPHNRTSRHHDHSNHLHYHHHHRRYCRCFLRSLLRSLSSIPRALRLSIVCFIAPAFFVHSHITWRPHILYETGRLFLTSFSILTTTTTLHRHSSHRSESPGLLSRAESLALSPPAPFHPSVPLSLAHHVTFIWKLHARNVDGWYD